MHHRRVPKPVADVQLFVGAVIAYGWDRHVADADGEGNDRGRPRSAHGPPPGLAPGEDGPGLSHAQPRRSARSPASTPAPTRLRTRGRESRYAEQGQRQFIRRAFLRQRRDLHTWRAHYYGQPDF